MSIEQEPQVDVVLDFHEMERAIHENSRLVSDTIALLRVQHRFKDLLPPELETELKDWLSSGDTASRVMDKMELQQISVERGANTWQRVKSGNDTTPDISPYYERSQADAGALRQIYAKYFPESQ